MGLGRYRNGKFDLVVIANYVMTTADRSEWERSLKKASELLYDASEGQMQFGQIFVCDDSIGIASAEFVLHDAGDPSYGTWGQFGTPGAALHLMPYVKTGPLTVLHEMGHHVWALNEEYSAPTQSDAVDRTNPAPNNSTIPIVDSGRAVDSLVTANASAILRFGTLLERRTVTANTATTVTVNPAFPDLPTNSDSANVTYQFPAECATAANAGFCIMEKSRTAAGTFDGAGNWVPAANPVTEFCAPSNHDPDSDTAQDASYNRSCWEVILDRAEFTGLTMPDPAVAGPTAGFTLPDWIVLDKQPRFALVMDRSGSMSSGHKMADAQHGAVYWLEFCGLGTDQLTVVWYDHAIDRILDLTQVDTLPSIQPTIDAINALTPRGSTNIRDALTAALDQIRSPGTRSAVQVALLLTDGIHNTPSGSSATEVLGDYQTSGTRIYALGVGASADVDMTTLEALANGTGGRSYAVGDNQPGVVETAMVEINAEVRGGIITTNPVLFPDSKQAAVDSIVGADAMKKRRGKRPPLAELLAAAKLEPDALADGRRNARIVAVPVDVEPKCQRVSFTVIFPASNRVLLYLVDPTGALVDMTGAGVHHVISSAPHEFAIVDDPRPGRWYVVAVRVEPGKAFTFRVVAGAENRNLQVTGGATPWVSLGGAVRLWARARWRHELSGLTVTATVVDPSGHRVRIKLRDDATEDDSGNYEALFQPIRAGRHHGIIEVRCATAITARPIHMALHGEKRVDLANKVPPFVRRIPISFEVGGRRCRPVEPCHGKDDGCPEDVERAKGIVERYEGTQARQLAIRDVKSVAPPSKAKAGKAKAKAKTKAKAKAPKAKARRKR